MLETEYDRSTEDNIAAVCAEAWGCKVGSMGPYSPFDKYFYSQTGSLLSVAEIKARKNRESGTFATAILNLDKYFTLFMSEMSLGIKGLYILGFTDGIYGIRIGAIDLSTCRISVKGREDRPGIKNDIRPVIEIPISQFARIR